MTHAQTNMKNSTKSVCSVSDVAQHVCDSGVSLACCGLQLAAVQQLPAYEDELTQKGLTELGTVPTRCWKDSAQSSHTL